MKNIVGKIVGFVLLAGIVFGIFVVAVVPFEMYKKSEAETWPSRKAVVTKALTQHHRGTAGKQAKGPYVTPEVCGTYKDTGEPFCVSRIRYGGIRWGEGRAAARETIAKYPVGREIDVYYDPRDPEDTVLEARSPWTEMYTLLGLGIAFLLVPVVLWLFRRRIETNRYGRT